MKRVKIIKSGVRALIMPIAIVTSVVLVPVATYAATTTASTTVNAVIGSVISLSTSGTVSIGITPVTGGSQTSASDTVTVSSNNTSGYTLTLADSDATTTLVSGANSIAAHTGTPATPTALSNNSWGFAVAGTPFDASYAVLSNATSSTTKWAGVPASGSDTIIKSTSAVATGDVTTVWYSAKADTSKPNGTYTDTVTYTAATKP